MNKQAKEDYEIIWSELVKALPKLLKEGRNGQIKLRLRKLKATFDKIFEENEIIDKDGMMPDDDKVNNPTHYQSMMGNINIDCITAMRAAFGDADVKSFCLLNSFKYLFRASSKGQNTDINKAQWYLNKFLELGGYE